MIIIIALFLPFIFLDAGPISCAHEHNSDAVWPDLILEAGGGPINILKSELFQADTGMPSAKNEFLVYFKPIFFHLANLLAKSPSGK